MHMLIFLISIVNSPVALGRLILALQRFDPFRSNPFWILANQAPQGPYLPLDSMLNVVSFLDLPGYEQSFYQRRRKRRMKGE